MYMSLSRQCLNNLNNLSFQKQISSFLKILYMFHKTYLPFLLPLQFSSCLPVQHVAIFISSSSSFSSSSCHWVWTIMPTCEWPAIRAWQTYPWPQHKRVIVSSLSNCLTVLHKAQGLESTFLSLMEFWLVWSCTGIV